MSDNYKVYAYDGPVMIFEQCVEYNWHAETMAPSEAKALSNFKYQYKKKINRLAGCKVTLPGKLSIID